MEERDYVREVAEEYVKHGGKLDTLTEASEATLVEEAIGRMRPELRERFRRLVKGGKDG